MAIDFRCTQCGKLLRTAEGTAGKVANCPACGAVVIIPVAGSAPIPTQSTGVVQSPSESQASPHQRDEAGSSPAWDAVTNPYQPPAATDVSPVADELATTALARVSAPAVALMVVAGIGCVVQAFSILVNVVTMLAAAPRNPDPLLFGGPVNLASAVVGIGSAFVVFYGAQQMKSLRSHGWAMASAIVAIIPCFSPCCILGIPFGIWAIVVISSPEVKSAFRG